MKSTSPFKLLFAASLFVLIAWLPYASARAVPNKTESHSKAVQTSDHKGSVKTIKLLQMDFPFAGQGKDDMNLNYQELSQSIADYPGVIWKIWTVNEDTQEAGGIYLFEDEYALNSYVEMHVERLKGFGITSVNSKVFDIPEKLTAIARGQLTRQQETAIRSSKPLTEMRLLQMDFPFNGPGKEAMDQNLQELSQSIADYPGVIWKIWTVNEETREGGGIYLFEDEKSLTEYVKMHTERLKGMGVSTLNIKIFEVPEVLTMISRGPIPQ